MKLNKTEVDRVDFLPDPASRPTGCNDVLTLGDLRTALTSASAWADDTLVIGLRGGAPFHLKGVRFESRRQGVIDITGRPAGDVPRETSTKGENQ